MQKNARTHFDPRLLRTWSERHFFPKDTCENHGTTGVTRQNSQNEQQLSKCERCIRSGFCLFCASPHGVSFANVVRFVNFFFDYFPYFSILWYVHCISHVFLGGETAMGIISGSRHYIQKHNTMRPSLVVEHKKRLVHVNLKTESTTLG